jgi:hypothetical protein
MGSNDPSFVDSLTQYPNYQSFASLSLKRSCRVPELTCSDYNNVWAMSCAGELMCDDTAICEGNPLFSNNDFEKFYSKDIFVEYVTCQNPSESLTNAIQYTIYAQIVILSLFFLVRKVYRHGFGALLISDTWMNLWHNMKPVRDKKVEENSKEGDDCGTTENSLPQKPSCCETVISYTNAAADKILEMEIPTSAHKLEGYSAWLFIIFIVGGNAIAFALLMHYFLYSSCTSSSSIAEQDTGPDVYNTGDRHICGTFGRGSYMGGMVSGFLVPCRLPTLSCNDYASYNADACASASTAEFICQEDVVCGDYTRPDLSFLTGIYSDIDQSQSNYPLGWSSGVLYTYLECLPVAVALTTTIQYLIFGQAFVLTIYFLIYTCANSKEGIFVLLKAKTWLNLYESVKPVKTDLIDEVKGKIAG